MTNQSVLIRRDDQKIFHVTYLSHWSDIRSEDGEEDSVKWVGGTYYVSASKGFGYDVQEES